MVFTYKRLSTSKREITIYNEPIEKTTKMKYLSMVIDNQLIRWDHIMYISGKFSRGMGIIIKSIFYKKTVWNLYDSFIYSHFLYCNQVRGALARLAKVNAFTKRIIRIIAGVDPLSHTVLSFMQLNILQFAHIGRFLIGHLICPVNRGTLELFQGYLPAIELSHTTFWLYKSDDLSVTDKSYD